jgi:hypothetical protein
VLNLMFQVSLLHSTSAVWLGAGGSIDTTYLGWCSPNPHNPGPSCNSKMNMCPPPPPSLKGLQQPGRSSKAPANCPTVPPCSAASAVAAHAAARARRSPCSAARQTLQCRVCVL